VSAAEPHLVELEGAMAAGRLAIATRTRLIDDDFEAGTYDDSRKIPAADLTEALSLIARSGLTQAVVLLGYDVRTSRAANGRRLRGYDYQALFVRPYTDGDGEDAFLGWVEKFENSWGAVDWLNVTVGPRVVRFELSEVAADEPLTIIPGPNDEVAGHAVSRILRFEVYACAN
jgi:hypothetical protein